MFTFFSVIMVNTFLPYSSYQECARVLDWKRLGKQRVEAQQILRLLEDLEIVAAALNLPYAEGRDVREYVREVMREYRRGPMVVEDPASGTFFWVPRGQVLEGGRPLKLGWIHHPATLMWFGYLNSLRLYLSIMITEWVRRGYVNNMPYPLISSPTSVIPNPPWLGREDIHLSHRRNLLAKNPEHYSQFFGDVSPTQGYVWPV